MNREPYTPEDPEEGVVRRMALHEIDIINTQVHEQLKEGHTAAENVAFELIKEVDDFLELADGEVSSHQEYERLMQKLDTAIAINNEAYARELRSRLMERFGK